jgi:Mg-chelatase subunit ChlD
MMKWLRRLRGQQGQVIIMFVGIFTVITLMGAITIDFGLWLSERRGVQRAADAAALAGSQDLPTDDAAAIQNAIEWARRNGYDKDDPNVEVNVQLLCTNTLPASVPGICHANPCRVGDHCDSIRVSVRKKSAHLFSKMFDGGDVYAGFASAAGVEFETGPTDVVLVIDRSGSMGKPPLSGGQFRIYWAKLAANNFVDQLAGDADDLGAYRVSVISFAGDATATLHLSLDGGTTASAVHAAIDSITTTPAPGSSTSTYIAPALTTATDQLNTLGRADATKVVVLLSDGRNWTNPGETPNATTRRNNTIAAIPALHAEADTVYSVGIGTEGSGSSELDVDLLEQIPWGPSGKYFHVAEASDLPEIFEEIAWKIAGRALTE